MWRFVQLSDPHLASERDGQWNNRFLCTMMPEVMECVRHDLEALAPEFILATGDLASTSTREAMLEARDQMDALGFPYYPMGGNHDFDMPESREWFLEAFAEHLPQPRTWYSFTHKNLHFCVLDPMWLWSDNSLRAIPDPETKFDAEIPGMGFRWAIPSEQLAWLEEDLRLHSNLPTLIAVHYPAIPIPDRLRQRGLRDSGSLENGEELVALLEPFRQVKAVFSGHNHLNYIVRRNGLTQVVTSALPEYPTEMREIQVFEDRLEVRSLPLSDSRFAKRSLIEGKEWMRGEEQDRSAVISLR